MKQEYIPRVIHYFWDKDKPLSYIQQLCFDSWQQFAPDFELKRWDEHNFDMDSTAYTRYHFEKKGWVMLSDYIRFYALATEGGIYLDTDMQLLKPLDGLLGHEAFIGFGKPQEHAHHVPWLETCCMGSKKAHPVFEEMCRGVEKDFVKRRHVFYPNIRITRYLKGRGLVRCQEQTVRGVHVLPISAFCPLWPLRDLPPGKGRRLDHSSEEAYMRAAQPEIKENTYGVHWFRNSWTEDVEDQFPESLLAIFFQKLAVTPWILQVDRLMSRSLLYQRIKNWLIERLTVHNMAVKATSSGEKK